MHPNLSSLQFKVLGTLALGLALCFAALNLHLSRSKLAAMMELGQDASRSQTLLAAGQARAAIERRDEAHLQSIYLDLVLGQRQEGFATPRVRALRVFDAEGRPLGSFGAPDGARASPGSLNALAAAAADGGPVREAREGDMLVVAAPVLAASERGGPGREVIGSLAIAWDHGHLRAAVLASATRHAALGLAGAAAMVLVLALLMRRMVLAPLARLAKAVEAIQASGRIGEMPPSVLGRRDEIGALATRVQALLGQLSAAREELVARSEAEIVKRGEQLNAALENMSQGLCMFDPDQRLVVRNHRFLELYGLAEGSVTPGMHIDDLLRACKDAGNHTDGELAQIEAVLAEQIRTGQPVVYLEAVKGGQVVSVARVPLRGGGWVTTFEDVTERRHAAARIEHMAHHDALTGLPNRFTFHQELGRALSAAARERQAAILCLDLDRFKTVNDTLGHPAGDGLLRAVAERLRSCVASDSLVARLSGDEFAVIVEDVRGVDELQSLAERVIATLGEPYEVAGHHVVVGASLGIAVAPADGADPDRLVKAADMALYRAKSDGRGTYRFFEREMDTQLQERRALETDLRQALAKGELEVRYQPIVRLDTNKVSCFEALLRWRHPVRGFVSPSDFVPLAEELGLIGQIGAWVLKEACRAAARWPGDVRVAVNLSPLQVRSDALVFDVDAALDGAGLAPERLEVEITETVLLQQTELSLAILGRLRALGVRISMDDFGTGYSSLSYLRTFPFDKIKIDRSFIRDLADQSDALAIVRAISSLGASLGMATTAEGVERRDQLDRLRLEGCTEVQGFYFSPAVSADEVDPLLARIEAGLRAAA